MHSLARPSSQRVLSVDVLRGLTIALMILVNDPGDWSHVYSQLDHAPWNGFTLTDFVFPNFLFLVGVSIILSLFNRIARSPGGTLDAATRRTLALHILRRALTIFAIKMALTAFPHFHWTHLRIFGVLTRIALCYLAAGLLCLVVWNARPRVRILVVSTAALLIGYWILMRFVPVPGLAVASPVDAIPTHSISILDPEHNLAAWLDRVFNAFTQHFLHTGSLYNRTHDPEGLLSTLPAIATTLLGCLTGLFLRRATVREASSRPERSGVEAPPHFVRSATESGAPSMAASSPWVGSTATGSATESGAPFMAASSPWVGSTAPDITPTRALLGLILAGLTSILAGLLWNPTFPINKNLWTSSYVLFSAGLSLVLLALCYWFIDMRRLNQSQAGKAILFPWLVFGSNAITAFVLSNFLVELMIWIKVPAGALVNPAAPATRIASWLWTYRHLFARHTSTNITSLAFALAFTALCFLPNLFLWRRKIFLKI